MSTPPNPLLALYQQMSLTRALEDAIRDLVRSRQILGTLHVGRGHEAVTTGTTAALARGDIVAPGGRDLGVLLARGIAPRQILAQWLRRAAAPSGGRTGAMHFGDMRDALVIPATALPTLAVAVGTALATKARGENRVTVAYLEDTATNTGDFHEAMNLAATQDLPVICVVATNTYVGKLATRPYRPKHLADRAAAYGIPGYVVDGGDVLAVREAMTHAVALARAGRGPVLLEAKIFRVAGQTEADSVPRETLDEWRARDPIERFTRHLLALDALSDALTYEFAAATLATVQDALAYAQHAPAPDPLSLMDHRFAPDDALVMGPPVEAPVGMTGERVLPWR
ncbi:MAG: thiamine pyrophosphate-dependent dehydrogenase E1 component subunit alpha [Ktedonobacterales bacterium]|nr:thiamine pyrophosphate-dependent dehydrogenase E1 component subunit alpha [Ktedonobacterales bacterium]